jgi:hypothetical protein
MISDITPSNSAGTKPSRKPRHKKH